jgi:DNA-binding transcriptional LysR family regulator
MQLTDVRIFMAVAGAGSLSAAGRQLDVGPMQVSRRIHVLEEELGVRLLHRTTRAVSLTAEGETFVPYARSMLEAEDGARAALRPAAATASGVLKLTAPSVFGQAIVMPLLPALFAQHPQLRIDLDLSDRVLDIVGEGFDLALRVATLGDSELVARRLAGNPRMLCASPQYLARHGVPSTVADLGSHACIALHAVPRWPLVIDGILQRISVAPRITTSNVDAARTAALQGLGLTLLTYWDVYRQLRDGELVSVVLKDAGMEDLSVWAMTPTRRFVPARVTIFLDALSWELARLQ